MRSIRVLDSEELSNFGEETFEFVDKLLHEHFFESLTQEEMYIALNNVMKLPVHVIDETGIAYNIIGLELQTIRYVDDNTSNPIIGIRID